MSSPPRFLCRRRVRIACVVLLAAAIAVVALKYWLGPRLLIGRVRDELGRVWDGSVAVAGADFGFTTPSTLRGLELTDRAGRRWLRVQTATLTVSGLAVTGLDLEGVECDLHFEDGRCRPPLLRLEASPLGAGPARVTIRRMSLRLVPPGAGASPATYDGLSLRVERGGEMISFELSRDAPGPGPELSVRGVYDPATGAVKAGGSLTHELRRAEAGALFAALGWAPLAGATGRIEVTATYDGPLKRPGDGEHAGRLELSDVSLSARDGSVADDVDLTVVLANGQGSLTVSAATPVGTLTAETLPLTYDLAGPRLSLTKIEGSVEFAGPPGEGSFWHRRLAGVGGRGRIRFSGSADYDGSRPERWLGRVRLSPERLAVIGPGRRALLVSDVRWAGAVVTPRRVEVTQLTGKAGGGKVTVQAVLDRWADPDRRVFDLDVQAADVDLGRLAEALAAEPDRPINGKLDLKLLLHGSTSGWGGLSGRGKGRLTQVDLWAVPVFSEIFRRLKLARAMSALSEARAVFDVSGPVVRIRRGVVTNQLAGIECTEGTIDLQTGQVDAIVVGGTFLTLNRFTGPLAGDVKAKLLGHRVRGRWDELGAKDFIPIPAGRIGDSSVKLLGQLAREGGKVGGGLIRTFEDLFKGLGGKKGPKETPGAR